MESVALEMKMWTFKVNEPLTANVPLFLDLGTNLAPETLVKSYHLKSCFHHIEMKNVPPRRHHFPQLEILLSFCFLNTSTNIPLPNI